MDQAFSDSDMEYINREVRQFIDAFHKTQTMLSEDMAKTQMWLGECVNSHHTQEMNIMAAHQKVLDGYRAIMEEKQASLKEISQAQCSLYVTYLEASNYTRTTHNVREQVKTAYQCARQAVEAETNALTANRSVEFAKFYAGLGEMILGTFAKGLSDALSDNLRDTLPLLNQRTGQEVDEEFAGLVRTQMQEKLAPHMVRVANRVFDQIRDHLHKNLDDQGKLTETALAKPRLHELMKDAIPPSLVIKGPANPPPESAQPIPPLFLQETPEQRLEKKRGIVLQFLEEGRPETAISSAMLAAHEDPALFGDIPFWTCRKIECIESCIADIPQTPVILALLRLLSSQLVDETDPEDASLRIIWISELIMTARDLSDDPTMKLHSATVASEVQQSLDIFGADPDLSKQIKRQVRMARTNLEGMGDS